MGVSPLFLIPPDKKTSAAELPDRMRMGSQPELRGLLFYFTRFDLVWQVPCKPGLFPRIYKTGVIFIVFHPRPPFNIVGPGILKSRNILFHAVQFLHCGGSVYALAQERHMESGYRPCRDAAPGTHGVGESRGGWCL